jgi:hypothetical protein
MYKGAVGEGVVWLLVTVVGYCCYLVPGLVIHIICIVKAASGNPKV